MKPDRIIPMPNEVRYKGKGFDLAGLKNITGDERFASAMKIAKEQLEKDLGVKLGEASEDAIAFEYDSDIPAEGYEIEITDKGIEIETSDNSGALYAVQTLRMAAMAGTKARDTYLPGAEIEDSPRFGWRGVNIDEARHFFGEREIKKIIDLMCLHKLNVLHWHLSDDQGWRIEIKKYPLLTEIGSKRDKSQINGWRNTEENNVPVSGFYTQEQIKDIVAYALERGVNIVPEIDMPAHLAAAMAAYPWLGCRELDRPVAWYFGSSIPYSLGIRDFNRSACVGSPRTMQFIKDVIDEVVELFPFGYFHIGGDEVPMEEWKKCPKCKEMMRKQGFTDYKQLHTWFINEVGKYAASKGRRLIGWNEILHGGNLDNEVLVQYWTPQPDGRVAKHLDKGGKVIISKHKHFYFDMPFSQYPLKNTYKFSPYFGGINRQNVSGVVGVEGELWAEWIDTPQKLEFQMNPRLAALSEVGWNKTEKKNYKEFVARLHEYFPMLDALGVYYAKEPTFTASKNPFKRAKTVNAWYSKDMNVEYDADKKL